MLVALQQERRLLWARGFQEGLYWASYGSYFISALLSLVESTAQCLPVNK